MFQDLTTSPQSQGRQTVPEPRRAAESPTPNAASRDGLGCLTLLQARHRRAEVEYAARTIRRLVQQEGWRYREIAVIVRRLEDYQALIEAIFPDYGIPFFTDQRRSVRHHPLVELLRATVRVAADNWRRVDVVRWLRTDLPTHSHSDPKLIRQIVDRLEQYADEHGLEGDIWRARQWRMRAPADDEVPEYLRPEVLNRERLHLTEPLAEFCQALSQQQEIVVHEALRALWRMIERLRVRDILQDWQEQARDEGRLVEAAEHAQVWDGLLQVFEELELALGPEKLPLQDFAAVLETALDSLTLGLVPPALDEVLIGAIERSRQPELRGVFLLGVNEGVFPLIGEEDAILNDSDRQYLQQHGMELAPSAEARHYQEQYLGYIAFTRASERLWVSYALADEQDRPLLPSPFIERLRRLFPDLHPQLVEGGIKTVREQEILTWQEFAHALATWLRQARDNRTNLAAPASTVAAPSTFDPTLVPQLLLAMPDVPHIVRMVLRARDYSHKSSIPPALAEELFLQEAHLLLSVSELESYAQCPFQFLAGAGVRLRPRQSFRLSRQDLGELLHRILQVFVRRYIRQFLSAGSQSGTGYDSEVGEKGRERQLRELLAEVAQEVVQGLQDDRFEASARRQHALRQACRILGDYVVALDRQLRHGAFVPYATELSFGTEESVLGMFKVPLRNTSRDAARWLIPRGRVDRIDIVPGSGGSQETAAALSLPEQEAACGTSRSSVAQWLRVVDYKLSPRKLDLDRIYHGLDLQLMVYLLVTQERYGIELARSCTFYAPLRPTPSKHDPQKQLSAAEQEHQWLAGYRWRGVFPEAAADLLDGATKMGRSPVVALFRKKDGQLGNRNQSDAVSSEAFQGLAQLTRQHLQRIGEGILQGQFEVRPTQHRGQIPCTLCAWLAVCRFERCFDQYRRLPSLRKEEVLRRLGGSGA
ncbi:ATP-dependent helicase/deoxyribonuclease subunit B [bacterium HR36]|nr:ATP-dependent helicase/deoxyribonuclease subunit B [bacterium HR36]